MKNKTFQFFKRSVSAVVITFAGVVTSAYATEDKEAVNPQVQTCSLMEILYHGDRAVSYSLPCSAGDWQLSYTGVVPAGFGKTSTNYRLKVTHEESGVSFSLDRRVDLPAVAALGRVLSREAVLLSNGDIGLQDCDKAGCANYRPLGAAKRLLDEKMARSKGGSRLPVAAKLSATVAEDRYTKVQSFSPATITGANISKKPTAAHAAVTADRARMDSARQQADSSIGHGLGTDEEAAKQFRKDNEALKAEIENLKSTVAAQAKSIDALQAQMTRIEAAIKSAEQAKVASLPPANTDNRDATTARVVKSAGTENKASKLAQPTEPTLAAKPATSNKTKVGKTKNQDAVKTTSKQSLGKATKHDSENAKPLPAKTSQAVKPLRAPKPVAISQKGAQNPIADVEYYRITPEGTMRVYRIEAPAVIEVLASGQSSRGKAEK